MSFSYNNGLIGRNGFMPFMPSDNWHYPIQKSIKMFFR